MGGAEGRRVIPREFSGFDYVGAPNYISLDHPSYLLESGSSRAQQREMLLESLQRQGYTPNAAKTISEHFDAMLDMNVDISSMEEDVLLLEGLLVESNTKISDLESMRNDLTKTVSELEEKNASRRTMLLEAVSALPVNLNDEQIEALVNLNSADDAKVVTKLFEIVIRKNFKDLPLRNNEHKPSPVKIDNMIDIHSKNIVTFSNNDTLLFK